MRTPRPRQYVIVKCDDVLIGGILSRDACRLHNVYSLRMFLTIGPDMTTINQTSL